MAIHSGSWIGLPDFGVTEAIGSLFGAPRTAEGGSNLIGGQQAATTTLSSPTYGPTYSGPVAGPTIQSKNTVSNPNPQPINPNPQPQQTTTNGGFDMKYYPGWDPAAALADWNATGGAKANTGTGGGGFDPNAQVRNDISSGWDNYINSLNSQLEGLGGQRVAQEGIAQSQYNQGVNTLGLQKTQGVQALDAERNKLQSNQVKTLRDVSGNLKNAFMAGNVYLGARGAGDSSAADQYALALTKEGSRQRGDVMAQTADQMQEINQRETNLNNIYNTEINNLEEIKNSKMGEIAQWFAEQQNAVRMAQANGQLNKSQDLASLSKGMLNQAISWMNDINSQVQGRKSALESWAMGVSKNIGELKNNMANISQFNASLPSASPIAGTPQIDSQGNFRVQTGYGSGSLSDEQKRLLGFS